MVLARAIFKNDIRRAPDRRGCRRDDYYRQPGRSTTLAGLARSVTLRSGPADAGPTRSRVHRTCHGPGFALRASTARAKCYLVCDVQRLRYSNALPILVASPLARSVMPTVFGDVLPPPHVPRQPQKAVTGRAERPRPFHAQPWSAISIRTAPAAPTFPLVTLSRRLLPRATVVRSQDPGPSHLLLEEKSNKCAGPPCGVAIATSIH